MNRCNAGKRLLHGNKRVYARCMINKEERERERERGTVPFFIYLPSLRLTSVHFAEHRAYRIRAEIFVPIECCGSANVIHSFLPSWNVREKFEN